MSEQEHNGMTLEGLARRLERLERENERMRSENAELRDEVARLQGSGTTRRTRRLEEPASESSEHEEEERVSRRWLLSKAGAAALGTVAAGALMLRDMPEAMANHFGPGIAVDFVRAHNEQANTSAIFGEHAGSAGTGVRGVGKGATGAGVDGRNNDDDGLGVYGEALRGNGTGVVGFGGKSGVYGSGGDYGGELYGGLAQLRLRPKGSAGKPTTGSHLKGELSLDSNARLFVCTADGTPGTWRSVRTAAT